METPYFFTGEEDLPDALPGLQDPGQAEQIQSAAMLLQPYELQVEQIKELAANLVIDSESAAAKATSVTAVSQKLAKAIDEKAKVLTKDANEYVKAVGNMAARLTAPLKEAQSSLKTKILNYQTALKLEAEQQRRKEQEALAQLQAELNKKAAELKVEAPVLTMVPVEQPQQPTRTEYGTTYIKKTWTFDVIDLDQVPAEYLMVNEPAVNRAIKAGVRIIPGLRIYPKETPVTRAN